MSIPILKQGPYLIASIESAVVDADLDRLREDVGQRVGDARCHGVVVDVTELDVMDSFTIRTLLDIAQVAKLRGAEAVIVGIQPEVAFAMVQLGLRLEDVATALDLEQAVSLLDAVPVGVPDVG